MKEQNLRWLEKEIKKDTQDTNIHKKKLIKEIVQTSKSEISRGPKKIDSKWIQTIKRIKKRLGLSNY